VSILGLFATTLRGGYGPISPSGSFGNLTATAPATATGNNVTLTYSGPTRNISLSYAGVNTLQYRINSGTWTTYSVAFAVLSGQALQLRVLTPTSPEFESLTITDASIPATIETVTVNIL